MKRFSIEYAIVFFVLLLIYGLIIAAICWLLGLSFGLVAIIVAALVALVTCEIGRLMILFIEETTPALRSELYDDY